MPSTFRGLAAAALLATGLAVPLAHAASDPSACSLTVHGAAGDASSPVNGGPNAADLDVTQVSVAVNRTTVTSTITVASLAEPADLGLGQYFETYFFSSAQNPPASVTFGSWRSARSGGGPSLYSTKTPMATTTYTEPTLAHSAVPTSLITTYDTAHNQVITTISRADLEAALGGPLSGFAPTLVGVRSHTVDPMPSYRPRVVDDATFTSAPFSFSACDRALARTPAPARPAVSPCALDIAAESGDEESPAPGPGHADVRDDSLDVTHVGYRITRTDLTVSLSIARLTPAPVVGTGQGYFAMFRVLDRIGVIGAYRDSQTGTQPAGTFTVTPVVAPLFDPAHNLVTLTVLRSDLATALGLKDTRSLVLTLPGAKTDARLNGSGLYTADILASAPKAVLSFSSCDKALGARRG